MQPPLNFANALVQLKLLTSQTANFTFTDDEVTQALTTAWQDSHVANIVTDSTLSFTTSTYSYAIPATLTTVREIEIKKASDKFPQRLSPDMYEIINGNINFMAWAQNFLSDTYTLILKGTYKLTVADSLTTDNLINYVLSNAAYILLRNLALKRAFTFLRNDTTMQEIVAARNMMRDDMLMWKRTLQREFESS